jgi:hypothetical protein
MLSSFSAMPGNIDGNFFESPFSIVIPLRRMSSSDSGLYPLSEKSLFSGMKFVLGQIR